MNTMELFSSLEQNYKLPQGFLNRLYQIESSGGKNLYNEKSGAAGPFQFIPSTARAMGLQNPNDLEQSAEAAARLAVQNRDYLQKKGVENVDGPTLFLAHNQGADNAYRLLTNPDRPATEVVGKEAVTWNAGKEGQPAGEFVSKLKSMYGEGGESSGGAYSALGTSEPVGQKEAESGDSYADERRASRRESYALNTLMGLTKELEPKPAPMLPIPRLSYAKGGIVGLVDAAEEVRAAGRGNDTVLAHITPQEAALLKARGGRGSINPKTGLPEFDDDWGGGWSYTPSYDYYTPSYDYYTPSYTPAYEPPTTNYTYDFGFGNNQDYYGSPTWSFTPDTSGVSQPGDYGSYNYGYNDVNTSGTNTSYVPPIAETPYVPPTYDPYQYYDAGTQVMPETAPEVISSVPETPYVPPETPTIEVPVYTPAGDNTGFTETIPVTAPVSEAASAIPVTTPMGDNTGFVETPVVETPRAPVTPVSFDLSKFVSPASTGVSGENISAIPQEPSTTPYIDVITGLSNADQAAYGTLAGVNFDLQKFLGPSEGGKFGVSGPEGSYVPQPVDTKSLAGVFGPQEATFSRYIDVRPNIQTEVYDKAIAASPYGKLEMEKALAAFGGVRAPTYTGVPSAPTPVRTSAVSSSIPTPTTYRPVTELFPNNTAAYVAPPPIQTGYEVPPTGPFYPDLLTGNLPMPTPAVETPRPNYSVLYDLANYLSKTPTASNVTPYVEVQPGSGTSSKQAPVPSFSSISYPTGLLSETKTS